MGSTSTSFLSKSNNFIKWPIYFAKDRKKKKLNLFWLNFHKETKTYVGPEFLYTFYKGDFALFKNLHPEDFYITNVHSSTSTTSLLYIKNIIVFLDN